MTLLSNAVTFANRCTPSSTVNSLYKHGKILHIKETILVQITEKKNVVLEQKKHNNYLPKEKKSKTIYRIQKRLMSFGISWENAKPKGRKMERSIKVLDVSYDKRQHEKFHIDL